MMMLLLFVFSWQAFSAPSIWDNLNYDANLKAFNNPVIHVAFGYSTLQDMINVLNRNSNQQLFHIIPEIAAPPGCDYNYNHGATMLVDKVTCTNLCRCGRTFTITATMVVWIQHQHTVRHSLIAIWADAPPSVPVA